MSERFERFLDRFTKPFKQNHELDLLVKQELRERVPADVQESADWDEKRAVLEFRDRSLFARYWSRGLVFLAIVTLVAFLFGNMERITRLQEAQRVIRMIGGSMVPIDEKHTYETQVGKRLTKEERLLLFGDLDKESKAERFRTLWELNPDNPACYADFVVAYAAEHQEMPVGYLETVQRIDPENGWFLCFAASVEAKGAVKAQKRSEEEEKQGKITKIECVDEAKLGQAMDLLKRGCELPRFDSYEEALLRQRIALLPRTEGLAEEALKIAYVAGQKVSFIRWKEVADALACQVSLAADRKDMPKVREMTATWKKLTYSLVSECHGVLVDPLVCLAYLRRTVPAIRDAHERVGVIEAIPDLKEMESALEKEVKGRKQRKEQFPEELMEEQGSVLAQLSGAVSTQSRDAPMLTDELLKPGRMAEYALFAQVLVVVKLLTDFCWGVVCVALYRFRHGKKVRLMSARIVESLDAKAWGWTFGGVLVPVCLFLIVWYFTPLDGRAVNMKTNGYMVPSGQLFFLSLLCMLVPVLIVRWRLGRESILAGWKQAGLLWGLLSVVLMFGSLLFTDICDESTKRWLILVSMSVSSLWMCGVVCRALFGKGERAIPRQVAARMLVPAYALALVIFALLFAIFRQEEKHWMNQDRFTRMDPAKSSINIYEYEVSMALRNQLLEIIAPLKK